jgi:hypothetical protein
MRGSKSIEDRSMARSVFHVQVGDTHKSAIFTSRTTCYRKLKHFLPDSSDNDYYLSVKKILSTKRTVGPHGSGSVARLASGMMTESVFHHFVMPMPIRPLPPQLVNQIAAGEASYQFAGPTLN